jgi:predicted alpha/beta hydrolase
MRRHADLCGQALAQAHARAGDAAAIAGYIGSGDALPRALAAFAEAYADQNQRDYEALRTAALADLPPETPRPGARIAHRGERADLHAST